MQNTITNRQMAFVLFIAISTSSVASLAKTMALGARHGAWITIILASFFFAAIAALIVKLNQLNEGKTLYEYSQALVGKHVGLLIGLFYVAYFFLFSLYYCNSFTLLVKANFMAKTPVWALLLAGIPIYGAIAYKGIRNIGRLVEILGLLFFIIMVVLFVSMLFQGTFSFILPLFNASDIGRYLLALKDTVEPFSGIEALLVIPFLKKNKRAPKVAFFSMLGIGLVYILDVYGCYAMIGLDEIVNYNFPMVAAIRLLEYPKVEFLQRMDVVYDTIGFMRAFLGISMLYLVLVELLCKMLPKAKRIVVVSVVGIALFLAGIVTFQIPNNTQILKTTLSMCSLLAMIAIPFVLFLITKVKKREKSNR